MMKLIRIWLSLLCIPLSVCAENQTLDQQLNQLEKEMHDIRLKIMHAEVQSQAYLKYEWRDYTREIEEAAQDEKKLEMLEAEYNQLKQKKEQLNH